MGMAYVEQYFQPKGGPSRMRTLSDLAREMPFAGGATKSSIIVKTEKTAKYKKNVGGQTNFFKVIGSSRADDFFWSHCGPMLLMDETANIKKLQG
jgi:hypothetical protein